MRKPAVCSSVEGTKSGWHGAYGWPKNPAPGAENTDPIVQKAVGLPSLERGRRVNKKRLDGFWTGSSPDWAKVLKDPYEFDRYKEEKRKRSPIQKCVHLKRGRSSWKGEKERKDQEIDRSQSDIFNTVPTQFNNMLLTSRHSDMIVATNWGEDSINRWYSLFSIETSE